MQRIIGLDIGSFSIKAVEIVNTFKSYEIVNFYENFIPQLEDVSPDIIIPSCMEQLFQENNIVADRILTAMPGQYVSSRILPFSFSDPRKVQAAVMSDIEDRVPYDMEDMIIDHQIIGQENGTTFALVVLTRKAFMRSFLEHLQRINIDPKLVDIDSLSFYNLSPHLRDQSFTSYAIVDVGHEKTSVCAVQGGVLRMFRSINLGGRYITEFLARDLEISFSEAQRVKHRVSRLLCDADPCTDLSPEDRQVAERITLAANTIVKELGRTLYAYKTPITHAFVSGGTARIKNFEKYLHEQLELSVSLGDLHSYNIPFNPALEKSLIIMPQSVAIGLRAVSAAKKHSQVNLRKDEFAYIQDYESILKNGSMILRLMAVVLLLLTVSYAVKYYYYSGQIDRIQQEYRADLNKLLPSMKKTFDKEQTFTKLRKDAKTKLAGEARKRKQAVDDFLAVSAGGALMSLHQVSGAIPKDVKIEVTQFQYVEADGGAKVLIKADTNSYEAIAKIVAGLKGAPGISSVEEKGSSKKPGTDDTISFSLQAFYGKEKKPG